MMQTVDEAAHAQDEHQRREGKMSRCVWLVEDDEQIRDLIAALLRTEGYEVVELCDGMEALNHLAVAEVYDREVPTPDLVVADILMPHFSGLDVLAGMRESQLCPPVLVVTGVRDPEVHSEAKRLGATGVISKPFDVDTLLHAVDQSLGQRIPARQQPADESTSATITES